jgi:hypothetical protein
MLQLVRGTERHTFKTFEEAGHWLLAQAGVRNVRIKQLGGRWALCEDLAEGPCAVMATTSVDDSRPIQARLLQLFCEEWSSALGFELAGTPVKSQAPRPSRRSSSLQSYMVSERAYIATFGH